MNNFDIKRIVEFKESTIKEYEQTKSNLGMNSILTCIPVLEKERKNLKDNIFSKFALRPLLREEIFREKNTGTYVVPRVIGLGESIAKGEYQFVIKTIVEAELEEQQATVGKTLDILKHLNKDETAVVGSTLYRNLLEDSKTATEILQLEEDKKLFYSALIELEEKIIILNRKSCILTYILFNDGDLQNNSSLKYDIGKEINNTQVDVLIYSLMQFRIISPEKNRVIRVKL